MQRATAPPWRLPIWPTHASLEPPCSPLAPVTRPPSACPPLASKGREPELRQQGWRLDFQVFPGTCGRSTTRDCAILALWGRPIPTRRRCSTSWPRRRPMRRARPPWTASKPTLPWCFWPESRAYKIKRAVKYPFLDFSTLEKRHRALLNELALNSRTAPQLYLEVIPITLGTTVNFVLEGRAEPKEWALVMRRFDQAKLYDRMAEEGRLPLDVMPRLAQVIADFHRGRKSLPRAGGERVGVARGAQGQRGGASPSEADACPADALATVNRGSRDALAALSLLLQGACQWRLCAALPRRSPSPQHRRDRRRAGVVRRHRVR